MSMPCGGVEWLQFIQKSTFIIKRAAGNLYIYSIAALFLLETLRANRPGCANGEERLSNLFNLITACGISTLALNVGSSVPAPPPDYSQSTFSMCILASV